MTMAANICLIVYSMYKITYLFKLKSFSFMSLLNSFMSTIKFLLMTILLSIIHCSRNHSCFTWGFLQCNFRCFKTNPAGNSSFTIYQSKLTIAEEKLSESGLRWFSWIQWIFVNVPPYSMCRTRSKNLEYAIKDSQEKFT